MKHVSNEQKAREIAEQSAYLSDFPHEKKSVMYGALEAMQWKDKERKELWRITRNRWQERAIEQLTAFAQHLNKRGAFRDDLCMDFEHEAQSFIEFREYQNNKEL